MADITLFEFEGCPFCRKTRAALRQKRLDFTRKVVKSTADYAELGRLNAARQAPVMVYDGEVVTDSTDILYFLEARHPTPALFPKDPQKAALCDFLEDWSDEALSWYGSTFRWVDPRNYQRSPQQLTIPGAKGAFARLFPRVGYLVGRFRVISQGIGRRPMQKIEASLASHLDSLGDLLGERGYLLGDEVSAADLAVWAQLRALRYCEQEAMVNDHAVVGPYLQRMDRAVGDEE